MDKQAERPVVQAQLAGGTWVQPMLFSPRELGLTDPLADLLDAIRMAGDGDPLAA